MVPLFRWVQSPIFFPGDGAGSLAKRAAVGLVFIQTVIFPYGGAFSAEVHVTGGEGPDIHPPKGLQEMSAGRAARPLGLQAAIEETAVLKGKQVIHAPDARSAESTTERKPIPSPAPPFRAPSLSSEERLRLQLETLIEDLARCSRVERAIHELVAIGRPARVPLIRALKDSRRNVRLYAAAALKEIGDPLAAEFLIPLLRDKDNLVRVGAADALGRLGDRTAVPSLIEALRNPDGGVAEYAAISLGDLGDRRAVVPLIQAVKSGRVSLRPAIPALGKLGDPRALGTIAEGIHDDDEIVRAVAVEALGRIGHARSIELLNAAVRDPDLGVRSAAAEGLGRLGTRAAVPGLAEAVRDKALGVRMEAVNSLSKIRDEQAVVPLLYALRDEEANIRKVAAESLEAYQGRRSLLDFSLGYIADLPSRGLTEMESALKKTAAIWSKAGQLGFQTPFRFSPELLETIVGNRLAPQRQNAGKVAVAILPRSDWNKAFYSAERILNPLVKHGYRVMAYEVSSDQELVSALRDVTIKRGLKADLLLLAGHGTRVSMRWNDGFLSWLNGNGEFTPGDEDWLRKQKVSSALRAGGRIVLDSCSTGKGRKTRKNMANVLRRLFPQAAPNGIWAPTASTYGTDIIFDKKGDFARPEYHGAEGYRAANDESHLVVETMGSGRSRIPPAVCEDQPASSPALSPI